ncbi:hypothetical protein [Chryseobacterium sp. 3008163]|uniref:hypothetical protein n=1 Tax=Chryseobacterium sp. 3008163 TaxID=2478663 RepID=UPI000F0C7A89|nr:hypothetical protein [Chryseobacterium sp. 3008163]AYN00108.1 hypothetical protein EAG08_07000 [Chryseobacterium sp. 3008163]
MKFKHSLILDKYDEYYLEEEGIIKSLEYLPNINKINIFIGTNNSGKSKFMRSLMVLDSLLVLDERTFDYANKRIIEFAKEYRPSPHRPLKRR